MAPITRKWPADRAILFVHGVGNAKPGDYDDLVASVNGALGAEAKNFACYELYYDIYNDWFSAKTQFAEKLKQAKGIFKAGIDKHPELADAVADYVGDVLWPVLSVDARNIVGIAYLQQLAQIVLDGNTAGVQTPDQHITIIAHSLGCFYTFEALHTAANKPIHALQPFTHGVTLDNVLLMAPPIQLIRHIGETLGKVVPNKKGLSTFAEGKLALPSQVRKGTVFPSSRKWVALAGDLDPVGGYFFGDRANWAYTAIDGMEAIIDKQSALGGISSRDDLIAVLRSSLSEHAPPDITLNNPHSWSGYVTRHEEDLRKWLA